jgi:hypothetical protein
MLRLTFTSRLSPDTDSPANIRCTTLALNSIVKTLSSLPPFTEHLPFTEKCPYFICLNFGVQSTTCPDFLCAGGAEAGTTGAARWMAWISPSLPPTATKNLRSKKLEET